LFLCKFNSFFVTDAKIKSARKKQALFSIFQYYSKKYAYSSLLSAIFR